MLTDKDIHDLKEFACKHKVDYVAASFVQSAADVRFIRSVLDEGGGFDVKIISKIENQEGLNNFKEVRLQGVFCDPSKSVIGEPCGGQCVGKP